MSATRAATRFDGHYRNEVPREVSPEQLDALAGMVEAQVAVLRQQAGVPVATR